MEIKAEVKTFKVVYLCDECEIGYMKPTGQVLMSFPMQFPHKCTQCENTKSFLESYPLTRYETIPIILENDYKPNKKLKIAASKYKTAIIKKDFIITLNEGIEKTLKYSQQLKDYVESIESIENSKKEIIKQLNDLINKLKHAKL